MKAMGLEIELPIDFSVLHPENSLSPATLIPVCLLARLLCATYTEIPDPEENYQLPCAGLLAYYHHHYCILDDVLDEL